MKLILEDCKDKELSYYDQPERFMCVIDNLNKQFVNGTIEVISLNNYSSHSLPDKIVSYEINSYTSTHNHVVADRCTFSASHYIGRFSNDGTDIIIKPRYGDQIFNYLICYATNIFIPIGNSNIANKMSSNSYWLIALLWKSMLNRALTISQTPKSYQTITKNQKNYKGHLNISKHIHMNLCDMTRFYCTYKKLSFDNTINRTIRSVYANLKQKGLTTLISEFEQYDKFLESMGVTPKIDANQIENVRYTRMNAAYLPVMNISKSILNNINAESSDTGNNIECSYFMDLADLWEMYLLKVLQRNLPSCYRVYSPNVYNGEFLINQNMREVRPDIIIEKDGRILAIIDAKYKNYRCLGNTSSELIFVQREDLYQMSTYLYHYGIQEKPIIGLFTSPVKSIENDIHTFSRNKNHKIGLVNLDIESVGDDITAIHREEAVYANTISNLLETL